MEREGAVREGRMGNQRHPGFGADLTIHEVARRGGCAEVGPLLAGAAISELLWGREGEQEAESELEVAG